MRRAAALIAALCTLPAQAQLFEAHSARPGAKMDISLREVERRPRSSVLAIEVRQVGSSVGSSFFIACSLRRLAQARGGFRHIVKAEETPARGQMLVGFLGSASDPPGGADPAFEALGPRAQIVELEQFAPICDQMK